MVGTTEENAIGVTINYIEGISTQTSDWIHGQQAEYIANIHTF
jgi:hypothetical protein